MDSELQKTSEDVIKAVQLIMNPMTPQNDRRIAHEFLENFKDSSPLCAKCGFFLIIKSNPALIRHCGFQLIENYIKLHWIKINDEEKAWIKNTAMQILASGTGPVLEEEVYVKDGMSKIIVELIKREWPQQWTSLLDELHHICKMGDAQTELVLLIFSRLVEDIVQFQNIPEKRRREIYTYLSSFVFRFFEFFSATLFENYEKYIDKKQLDSSIADKETLICCKLIQVTLDTISIFVEWVSIECIKGNRILFSLLCKMLSVPDFRLKAVICMLNVVERKTPPEERKELLFFFEESIIFELINNLDVYNQDNYLFFKTLLQCFLALGTNLSSCMTQFDIEAPTNFSLYLNCVISFTRHPSVVLSQIAQNIWMNILRSPILSVDPLVQSFVPVIFKHGIEKLIKCGYPSQNDCLSCKFSQIEFDSDEDFEKALYRCRSDVIENFKLICKIQPKAAFQFGSLLLKSLINGQDWKTYLDNPIAVMSLLKCWEAIVLYMEPICCVLLKNIDNPEVKDLLNEGLELLDLILNFTYDDAVILSLSLSCISALFFFITFQPELRVTILEKIFFYLTCFAHKTPNDREILNLRRHASSLLIKLSTNFPKILLPEFDNLCSKVQTLFQNKEQVTRFEKCALLEALMILSNNFCDYDRQSNFLKAALSFIDSVWICPPIIQGIESCDAFISFIGIDKHPPSPNENTINPFASDLIMGINVIKACVKRCVCPSDPQSAQRGNFVHPLSDSFGCVFYRNPAAQYVIPVLDKIFQIVRILNELYDPLQQQKFDSSYCKLLDITDADKSMILGIPVVENPQQLKTASDHARFYLHNLHDACLHILCNAVENLGIDFYIIHNLPNLLKGNILHKIEYMPAMKLRNLVRLFFKPFFLRCPPTAYDELMVFLAGLCPFMLRKLNCIWEIFRSKYGTSVDYEDHLTETEEILEDQLNRVLTREYLSFLVDLLMKQSSCSVTEDYMESEKKIVTNNQSKKLTELGLKILQTESIRAVFVCTAFDSLRWLDTTANIKAILLSELVFDKIMEEGLVQQIQEANYLLQSVLYGIQELGEHEPNLSSLLSFGVHVYEELRHCFQDIQSTLMSSVACNQQSIRKLNEAITETTVKNKKDKLKKEAFKSAIQKIIGKNIGQRHKKDVVIKDLPPLIRLKQKEDSSLLDIEPNDNIGLCNLFSDNQNSC